MDSEEDIKMAAEKIMKDIEVSKLDVYSLEDIKVKDD
jgi:ribosome biogenesis GTPase A